MSLSPLLTFLGSAAAFFLAVPLIWQRKPGSVFGTLTALMFVTGWVHFSYGMGEVYQEQFKLWMQAALVGEILRPVLLYEVSLFLIGSMSLSLNPNSHWRLRVIQLMTVCLGVFVIIRPQMVIASGLDAGTVMFMSPWGWGIWSFILVVLALSLSRLEHVVRATSDPLRYQLKFVIFGLGGMAAFTIVQAGRLILYPLWNYDYTWVSSLVTLMCVGLIAIGLQRWKMEDISGKIYVSHHALYTSFSFLIVGLYLFGVGFLAEAVRQIGWTMSEALGTLLLFMAAILLMCVVFSRQARAELKVFISRNFYRSKYDYRSKWLEITEAFGSCHSTDSIFKNFLDILGRTFGASKVTIWLRFEADGQYHQVCSVNTEPPPKPIDSMHPVVKRLHVANGPITLDEHVQVDSKALSQFIHDTEAVVCVPLMDSEHVMGFVTLSHELQEGGYVEDDFDLLRAMAHHVSVLLLQAKLTEERTAAAEWEAVHRFSTFYIHDLKNLASGLSLVVQNAEVYGKDPEFQSSAMRTVANTSQRIMELMTKISTQSRKSEPDADPLFQEVNLNSLVIDTIESLNGARNKTVFVPGVGVSTVSVVPEQFKQVLLNLILNAKQAMDEQGIIEVKTGLEDDCVVVTVADTGSGIPPLRLRTLFQPFSTTKKEGLGVGLYQCKQVVERHKGSIRIESQEGLGTRAIISLPSVGVSG